MVVRSDETVTWSLTGDDSSDFNIGRSDGMLTFRATPDFENPADNGGDNTYEITVNAAIAGGAPLSMDVTVDVTNVDEDGEVTISPSAPGVGTTLTATLTDSDAVTAESWQWARSEDGSTGWTDIPGATANTYRTVEADAENYLRATASYTDGEGSGKSESAVSDNAVTATAAAPTTGSELGDTYDTNKDGEIERDEVLGAIVDFVGGDLNRDDVLSIILLFVAS